MKDLKYLAAFSLPLMACVGLYLQGIFSFLVPIYAFVLLPALEMTFPVDESNLDVKGVNNKLKNKLFDWLLYLNVPIVFGLLFFGLKLIIWMWVRYPLFWAN